MGREIAFDGLPADDDHRPEDAAQFQKMEVPAVIAVGEPLLPALGSVAAIR
jgi:hypothetical protein